MGKNNWPNARYEYRFCKITDDGYAGRLYREVINGKDVRCCLGMYVGDSEWPILFHECEDCPRYIKNVQETNYGT